MLKSELIDQLAAEFSGLRKPEIERAVALVKSGAVRDAAARAAGSID